MMKAVALAMLSAVANAGHLAGPMDERLQACATEKCPDYAATFGNDVTSNYNGMDQTFPQLIGGQVVAWVTDLTFVLNTIGYVSPATCTETATTSVDADAAACAAVTALDDETACEAVMTAADDQVAACAYAPAALGDAACTYTEAGDGYTEVTKAVTNDVSHVMACVCSECGATLEAIFQPIGRDVCTALGVELPCADELAACEATDATAEAALYTGENVVGTRTKAYVAHMPPSPSKCSPGHSAFAYQADNTVYPLAEFTAAETGGTCSKAGFCRALVDTDEAACAAATTEADCGDVAGPATEEACVETAEPTVADDAAACAAVDISGADAAADETSCEAVGTTATEECGADPSACTYVAAAEGAPKCEWVDTVTMDAETVALQTCLATSRIAAYEADYNCLEHVSGPACGEAYQCTYVEPVDEEPKTSDSAVATAAVSTLAFVVANL